MRLVIALFFLYVVTATVEAHDQGSKSKCDKTKQQIRLVQSKMRAGYTRAQGEKLEARLRKLRADRGKFCR